MSIEINGLEHVYSPNTPFEHAALKGIDCSIAEGKVTAIIGQTGSGKSTLVQHLNGLLVPTGGSLDICGFHIQPLLKIKDIKELRLKLVRKVLPMVGLDESYLDRSPFELSGGQKRRVAIAGILILDPEVLVLDEPTAGLDPQGAKEMMTLFMNLNRKLNKTVLLVTHDMNHVMNYCDDVMVLDHGKLKHKSDVKTFFEHPDWMINIGIEPPALIRLKIALQAKGFDIPDDVLTLEALGDCIEKQVKAHE